MKTAKKTQLNILGNALFRRILSGLLALSLLCTVLPGSIAVKAADTASANGIINMDAADLTHTETLTDNGNGTYTLTLNITAKGSHNDVNTSENIARNDYFTATHDGDYLVELWGGDGAGGEVTPYSYNGQASIGGQGGYIYGVVSLKKGDTLFYTLGGNGVQTTSTSSGGGVNGDGGHHGDLGSYTVGGGGGYSAVFLFEAGSGFESTYLDSNGNVAVENILESDRLTRYIMIAGGGGGGGAGNSWSLQDSATGTPDGGAGGNLSSPSDTVGDGYYFAGSDGLSSGPSVDYVGHGGTNVPGIINDTISNMGWFEGKQPNDWTGTQNTNYEGGSGGSGNFRGGAGGGGFAGGSGGVQLSLLSATNVGGGGGGSSYIAKTIYDGTDYQNGNYPLTTTGNPSSSGGAVVVTCLGAPEEDAATMANFSFGGTVSQYFSISDYTLGDGFTMDLSENGFAVSGDIHENDLQMTLVLARKSNFTGGNNVPLIAETHYAMGGTPTDIVLDEACTHANVPLNFDVTTYNYVTEATDVTYHSNGENNLFDDLSASWTGLLGYGTFVSSIEGYTVNGDPVNPSGYTPDSTGKHTYTVAYTVTVVDTGVAEVGEAIDLTDPVKTISADAIVTIIGGQNAPLENGASLNLVKKLRYNGNGTYTLSLDVNGTASSDIDATLAQVTKPEKKFTYGTDTTTYTVEKDGYYLIQAWGGNGGNGGGGRLVFGLAGTSVGGQGGQGGYVSGYVHLKQGDTLSFVLGSNGANGESNTVDSDWGKSGDHGTGGGYTYIQKTGVTNDGYLLIAGGGGGGERGEGASDGKDGYSVTETLSSNNQPTGNFTTIYHGQTAWDDGQSEDGGSAGKNYKNTSRMDLDVSTNNTLKEENKKLGTNSDYTNNGGGAIYITCLQLDNPHTVEIDATELANLKTNLAAKLANCSLTANFSPYFYDFSVVGTNHIDENGKQAESVLTLVPDTEPAAVGATGITPVVAYSQTVNTTNSNATVTANVSYTVEITFRPKDGFLGGNDVPVLIYNSETETGMALTSGEETVHIEQQDSTDFANVVLVGPDANDLTVFTPTYILGTGTIANGRIYAWESELTAAKGTQMADYVTITEPLLEKNSWTPSATDTTNKITVSVTPKYDGTKAVVIPAVTGSTIAKTAVVNIINQIDYSGLVNMTTSHVAESVDGYDGTYYLHPLDTNYAAILTPASGYVLPDTITVTAGGNELTAGDDYIYYSDTGEVLIYAESIGNRPVAISAEGQKQTYNIYFISQDVPSLTKTFTYESGSDLTGTDPVTGEKRAKAYAEDTGSVPQKEGYTFLWEWDGYGTNYPETMPAGNQWVIGSYIANQYTLVVNYVTSNGQPAFDTPEENTKTLQVYYGQTYSVVSPEKTGYLPDQVEVSGTMGLPANGSTLTVTVTYTPTANQLNIIHIFEDDSQPVRQETHSFDTDEVYSVALDTVDGYTRYDSAGNVFTDTSISGTMSADGRNVYLYYRPNNYTVNYQYKDGGNTVTVAVDTVQFNQAYGYDPATGKYGALPTPIRTGYSFGGWYLTEACAGSQIKAESKVTTAGNHSLYAKWTVQTFNVTVNYLYEDGSAAAETQVESHPFGSPYSIVSPTIPGFELKAPEQGTISGTMSNQNLVIDVVYIGKEHTLSIYYKYADGTDAFPAVIKTVRYKQPYSVASPAAPENFACSQELVSGEMPDDDVTVTVYYRSQQQAQETVVSVTVTWGDLNFSYDYGTWNPETHTYENTTITSPADNTITVTSNQGTNVEVIASYAYQNRGVYPLDVYFTPERTEGRENEMFGSITLTGDPSATQRPSKTVYVWVDGQLPYGLQGKSLVIGQCSVTLSAGANITTGGDSP